MIWRDTDRSIHNLVEVVLSPSGVGPVHPEAMLCGILFPFHLRAAQAEYSKGDSSQLPNLVKVHETSDIVFCKNDSDSDLANSL